MIRVRDIAIAPGAELDLLKHLSRLLKCSPQKIKSYRIYKKSIDARKKTDVRIIYALDVSVTGDEEQLIKRAGNPKITEAIDPEYVIPAANVQMAHRPVVVGFGPAGMFAALILSEAGLQPIVIERGSDADKRTRLVEAFWNGSELNPGTNVQFGEGGAGTFSDGKLNTGIKDPRIRYVLKRLVEFGAHENILSDAKPHVGTDILRNVVKNLRNHLIALGAEVRFETKLVDFSFAGGCLSEIRLECNGKQETLSCENMILAPGHSARDTFRMLLEKPLNMEPKPFSMGVRIEHLQSRINFAQYGDYAECSALPPADYKLNCKLPDNSSAYTFCMCPGGYVVAAASEPETVVTNGMSYSGRNGVNANSALLVTLQPEDFPYPGPLGGVQWQEEIEHAAYVAGGSDYSAPAQLVGDFLQGKPSTGIGAVSPTYRPGVRLCNLDEVLPGKITSTLRGAIKVLDNRLEGFADPEAVLTAPETRSSSPVRILRDETCQAAIHGFYPCGEGAGYAGGIMSAAVDGMRCAEALLNNYKA